MREEWTKFTDYKNNKMHVSIVYDEYWELCIYGNVVKLFDYRKEAINYAKKHFKNTLVYVHKENGEVKKRLEI